MDNLNLYEQANHWGRLENDVSFLKKVKLIKALIPDDVETILDAGCGDGALTNLLVDSKYRILGLDRSQEALNHVNTDKIKGSINKIPFSDDAFDLVVCSQVLEHLPEEIYRESINELMRVSKKYLIIGVPYRERLMQNTTKCFNCGVKYHLWGHVRNYKTIEQVSELFPKFRSVDHIFTSTYYWHNQFILWLKRFFGNEWPWEETAICPKCGLKNIKDKYSRFIKYVTDGVLWRLKGNEEYWWSVTLFVKKDK